MYVLPTWLQLMLMCRCSVAIRWFLCSYRRQSPGVYRSGCFPVRLLNRLQSPAACSFGCCASSGWVAACSTTSRSAAPITASCLALQCSGMFSVGARWILSSSELSWLVCSFLLISRCDGRSVNSLHLAMFLTFVWVPLAAVICVPLTFITV